MIDSRRSTRKMMSIGLPSGGGRPGRRVVGRDYRTVSLGPTEEVRGTVAASPCYRGGSSRGSLVERGLFSDSDGSWGGSDVGRKCNRGPSWRRSSTNGAPDGPSVARMAESAAADDADPTFGTPGEPELSPTGGACSAETRSWNARRSNGRTRCRKGGVEPPTFVVWNARHSNQRRNGLRRASRDRPFVAWNTGRSRGC